MRQKDVFLESEGDAWYARNASVAHSRAGADPDLLLIQDFYSPVPTKPEYRHRAGVFSYKMDYRRLFTWHPAYIAYSQRLSHHLHRGHTDLADEWVAPSELRKPAEP